MLEFENSLSIDRPVDQVFAFLSDFENLPKCVIYDGLAVMLHAC
jgi:uncharacterized membrane protein